MQIQPISNVNNAVCGPHAVDASEKSIKNQNSNNNVISYDYYTTILYNDIITIYY